MLKKILLALRNNGHEVDVVTINGETRPVLGRSHPEEEDPRVAILRQWGMAGRSPREEPAATIDEPLDQRTQTILSRRLSPELRRRIDSGMGGPAASRRDVRPGTEGRHPLDGEAD